jgi:hypothetical protein
MNLFKGMVAVVALSAATSALSEESSANADVRQVIALASTSVPTAAAVEQPRLEDLVGSYEIDGASAFVIATDGDALFIEFSEDYGIESPRLRADVGDFFVAEVDVLVTFDRDADGSVVGATIHPSNAQASLSAVKAPLRRGIVTVYDVVSPRRGIVSIYDVANDADAVTIAAAF